MLKKANDAYDLFIARRHGDTLFLAWDLVANAGSGDGGLSGKVAQRTSSGISLFADDPDRCCQFE